MLRSLTRTQLAVDLSIAVVFFLLFGLVGGGLDVPRVLVAFGMAAALALRRLSPGLALTVAWAASLLQVLAFVSPQPSNVAILAVLYSTSAYGGTALRWIGFISSFAGALVITVSQEGWALVNALTSGGLSNAVLSSRGVIGAILVIFFASLAAFLLSWTVGMLVRTGRRAGASRRVAEVATQEVVAEQERTRIARDMHDVVAHSLAVVVAQADGARYLGTKDPVATDAALSTIATTAREALSDVRVLLAQLRHSQEDGPQPTLVDLDRLFEQLRGSGLTIAQEVTGVPLALGVAQQLAVYRIVQESLTNALRHADTAREVVVHFGWTPHGLDLTVSSSLRAPVKALRGRREQAPVALSGSGHGIAGMTERAVLVGGRLAATGDGERFVVRAWLPEHAETTV
jgi:signal transduction histidine kinase